MTDQPVVLYIEDDPQSREVMRVMLYEEMGITNVFILDSSEDLVARVDAFDPKPTIIFLDIHMEPLNGFEMLALFREHPVYRQLPIVALTASVMNEEVLQLKRAGFNGVISKPVDIDSFADTLKRLLRGEEVWRITY